MVKNYQSHVPNEDRHRRPWIPFATCEGTVGQYPSTGKATSPSPAKLSVRVQSDTIPSPEIPPAPTAELYVW